jgi:homoserine kinase
MIFIIICHIKKDILDLNFKMKFRLSRGLGSSSAVIVSAIASAYAIEGIKLEKDKLLKFSS